MRTSERMSKDKIMRTSVLFFFVLTVALAIVSLEAAPAPPNRSSNPNVNLIHQGLIEKLCKRDQQLAGGRTSSSSTTSTSTSRSTGRGSSSRRSRQAPAGPSCTKYNNYTFAQLIEENKKLLRPVGNRRP